MLFHVSPSLCVFSRIPPFPSPTLQRQRPSPRWGGGGLHGSILISSTRRNTPSTRGLNGSEGEGGTGLGVDRNSVGRVRIVVNYKKGENCSRETTPSRPICVGLLAVTGMHPPHTDSGRRGWDSLAVDPLKCTNSRGNAYQSAVRPPPPPTSRPPSTPFATCRDAA